jgi:hypothetical protein
MIILGHNTKTRWIKGAPAQVCSVCGGERPFSIVLQYQYDHIYFIFGLLRWRHYYLLCDVCHNGEKLDRRLVEKSLGEPPIPFLHRYGCLMLPLLFVLFIVVMTVITALTGK